MAHFFRWLFYMALWGAAISLIAAFPLFFCLVIFGIFMWFETEKD